MKVVNKPKLASDKKKEERLEEIKFKVHKFSNRKKPNYLGNIAIFPCFSEFGSEIIGTLYCIPILSNTKYRGKYTIAVGWHGRSYLYKHLVDEFWELDEKHQWLREYCRAFHHESRNLKFFEKHLEQFGKIVHVNDFGLVCLAPPMDKCTYGCCGGQQCSGEIEEIDDYQVCKKCGAAYNNVGLYNDIVKSKQKACWTPMPSKEVLDYVDKYLKPNSVGITARNRQCYGRNLQIEFYERLIYLLEDMGYNPIWIGEEATTHPCPVNRITDFSRAPDARDLEKTLALVSKLKFTVQFWTASTRLAGLMGTPFLLFESPDQILNTGQEAYRLSLSSRGPYKLVLSHYLNVFNDNSAGLELVKQSILEMQNGNYNEVIGMIDDPGVVQHFLKENKHKRLI